MKYYFTIQYDNDKINNIDTFDTEAANAEEAIANFRDTHKTERVWSVEMVTPSYVKAMTSPDHDEYCEVFLEHEDEIVQRVCNAIRETEKSVHMTFAEFLNKCTACGGNWTAMLLTGIKACFPEYYKQMPDKTYDFCEVCEIIKQLGVDTADKKGGDA